MSVKGRQSSFSKKLIQLHLHIRHILNYYHLMSDDPLKIQFHNRLNEVLSFDLTLVNSKETIKDFLNKIEQFVSFIEKTPRYTKKIKSLETYKPLKEAEKQMLQEGDEILKLISSLHQEAEKLIKARNIKLPTQQEVFAKHPSGVVYSPSVDETLGGNLDSLKRMLNADSKVSVEEISGMIFSIKHTEWDFNTLQIQSPYKKDEMENLENLGEDFKKLKEEYERQRRNYGITDYDVLMGIYEKMIGKVDISGNQLSFLFSHVGRILDDSSRSFFRTPTFSDAQAELGQYKERVKSIGMRIEENEAESNYVWYKRIIRTIAKLLLNILKWALNRVSFGMFSF